MGWKVDQLFVSMFSASNSARSPVAANEEMRPRVHSKLIAMIALSRVS